MKSLSMLRPGIRFWAVCLCIRGVGCEAGRVVDLQRDVGCTAGVVTEAVAWVNGRLLNASLAALEPGDTLLVPRQRSFYIAGGIMGSNLHDVRLQIDGGLNLTSDITSWPRTPCKAAASDWVDDRQVMNCITFLNCRNVTIAGSGSGSIRWATDPLEAKRFQYAGPPTH